MNEWKVNLQNLVFVDVETTGLSSSKDRIIEVGVVRIHNGRVVERFNSLVNPGVEISAEITRITGIRNYQLKDAVSFKEIASELLRLLNTGVFVAHNATFDYGFIENEFKRIDIPFTAPRICTVELSRALYPGDQRHSLDVISDKFNIKISNRHRAFDDAMATWLFYQRVNDIFDDYALNLVFNRVYQPARSLRVDKLSKSQLSLLG